MDTKLKNMSSKWYVKAVAYLILVACVLETSLLFWTKLKTIDEFDFEVLNVERFEDSYEFYQSISEYVNAVLLTESYDSVEEIEAGLYEDKVKELLINPYQEWVYTKGTVTITAQLNYDNDGVSYNYDYDNELNEKFSDFSYQTFINSNRELEEVVRQSYIKGLVKEYQQGLETLKNETQFVYATGSKEEQDTCIKEFETYPIYGYIKEDGTVYSNVTQISTLLKNSSLPKIDTFFGVKKAYYDEMTTEWLNKKKEVKNFIEVSIIFVLTGIIAFLYLVFTTGRRPKEDSIHLYPMDKIWSELYWIVGILSGMGIVGLVIELFDNIKEQWMYNFWLVCLVLLGTLFMECILTQVRRLKARKFLEGFLCFRIIKRIYNILMASWKRGKLSKRAIALSIILPLLCVTWVGAPFVIAFLIYMIYKYMGDFNEIIDGTKKIREGALDYKIQVKNDGGVLGELADNINSLSKGLEAAVSNELRSERLKSELISNVSHDLKTPLTSIVTYVDLLKQEEIDNETAKDYIDVIDRKAERLTVLTSDLFEAAKASSGDMPVNLEKVDLNAIIRQALGEFDERIHNANLEIRTKLPEGSAYIFADGKLTWRVLENLLSNAVKYAQSGSRVYMEVEEEKTELCFTMKNVSGYELNISADELLERFKRGDESRNSEGSGLGLSIANSLVSLQQGRFKIQVDGDLFKVTMYLKRYTE